jgi:hypothetical protein
VPITGRNDAPRSDQEKDMATRSYPYHSKDQRDPQVFHDYSDCPNGQQIAPGNWAIGTGELDLCGSCARLD